MSERRGTSPWLLPGLMFAGGVLGVLVGTFLTDHWAQVEVAPGQVELQRSLLATLVTLAGTVFLSLLKALIIPLIATSIVVAVQEVGGRGSVLRMAVATFLYFLTTTALAAVTGLFLVTSIHPGSPHPGDAASAAGVAHKSTLQALTEQVEGMFPPNLVDAAGSNNVLGVIVFALLFGAAVARLGERGRPVAAVFESANQALFQLVHWIIWLAPIGILGLVADRLGREGGGEAAWRELVNVGSYSLTVLAGLAIHSLVTLPLLLWLLTRRSVKAYMVGMSEAVLTAFGTASSAATLAMTRQCTVERNGVSKGTADFVLPIGATVNMDGTALYEAVAVVFIAQSAGIELGLGQLIVVALTATLAAIGAAAIPQAGLVTMVLVLEAVGLPAEGIGLILSVDWILDRFRTGVNIWGDSVGAAVVDRHGTARSPG
jgi:Na+/H+-dicarboxylate symporter